jgi:16S rRNA U1498 N3-methylase RsmE
VTGAEIAAIITAVGGIVKLTTAIIEAIQQSGEELPPEVQDAIRQAHAEVQEATERLSVMPTRPGDDDD